MGIVKLKLMKSSNVPRPSQENIERAKEYVLKALESKNVEILQKILDGGFPPDEPLLDHSQQTMLMACCEIRESSLESCTLILKYNPKINL